MARIETQRIDIRIPVALLQEIDKYQEDQNIPNRTTAMLELVRLGLHKKTSGESG